MKKKYRIFSIVVIAVAMIFNFNLINNSVNSSNVDLGNLMIVSVANAEENESDCDNDINDLCWDPDTGTKYTDCEPSTIWDTCGN